MIIDRRGLLALGGLTVVGTGLGGCSDGPLPAPSPEQSCIARSALSSSDHLDRVALIYEDNGRQQSFAMAADFAVRLSDWQEFWRAASGLPDHDQLWTYGTWIDGGSACSSAHHRGRAIDITRLHGGGTTVVSCRVDQWSGADAAAVQHHTRRYWSLAASLHAHFAYVLTHLHDDQHSNHLHVDDVRSRGGEVHFETSSRAQCAALQAIITQLWQRPVAITGSWDRATRRASAAVIDQLGGRGDAARAGNWATIMRASTGRAAALEAD